MNIMVAVLGHEIVNDSLTPPQAGKQSRRDRPIGDDLFVDRGRSRITLTQGLRRIRNLSFKMILF
jgi:hypothetical protein